MSKRVLFIGLVPIVLSGIMFMFFSSRSDAALFDQKKFQLWQQKSMERVVEIVERDGKAYVPFKFMDGYDRNKDGVIDREEVQSIRKRLSDMEEAERKKNEQLKEAMTAIDKEGKVDVTDLIKKYDKNQDHFVDRAEAAPLKRYLDDLAEAEKRESEKEE